MTKTTNAQPAARRTRKMVRAVGATGEGELAEAAAEAPSPTPQTKAGLLVGLLQRPDGATLDELVEATGWQPHTTRAALTGLRKKGHPLTSEKIDGPRRYRIVIAGAGA